jgi:hypothetical protein
LVQRLFLTYLSRRPDEVESRLFAQLLAEGFANRETGKPKLEAKPVKRAKVDWDKHLEAEASVELLEAERIAREGAPPTARLTDEYRRRVEDAIWTLVNTPEFVFVP